MKGPYDASTKASWDGALGKLKEFNRNVVITRGNAGTLDMLSHGEIAMGPVELLDDAFGLRLRVVDVTPQELASKGKVPDQAVLRRHPGKLRAQGTELIGA